MGKLKTTVQWYQTILNVVAGYHDVPVNGNHNDRATQRAMQDFQHQYGLEVSGVLNTRSNLALRHIALQWVYREFINGRPGWRGDDLDAHVQAFQADYGLVVDGDVGPATMSKMTEVLSGTIPIPWKPFRPKRMKKPFLTVSAATRNEVVDKEVELDPESTGGLDALPIGGDDRVAQTNTKLEPNRWLCLFNVRRTRTEVLVQWQHGSAVVTESQKASERVWVLGGSGCLISPRHVLTAAHVLSQFGSGGFDFSRPRVRLDGVEARVSPGFNGVYSRMAPKVLREPYGSMASTKLLSQSRYASVLNKKVVAFNERFDYALIDLGQNVANLSPTYTRRFFHGGKRRRETVQNPRLGFWGENPDYRIRATTPAELQGRTIHTIGYPVRRPEVDTRPKRMWMQWRATGKVDKRLGPKLPGNDEYAFFHDADISNGHSGSPMWIEEQDGGKRVRTMVGIVVKENAKARCNVGYAFTDELLRWIEAQDRKSFRYKGGQLTVKTTKKT